MFYGSFLSFDFDESDFAFNFFELRFSLRFLDVNYMGQEFLFNLGIARNEIWFWVETIGEFVVFQEKKIGEEYDLRNHFIVYIVFVFNLLHFDSQA